jgi:hypothetical protein
MDSVLAALKRRAPVEQFLKRYADDGRPRVAWVEVVAGTERYEVRRFDAEDRGGSNCVDLYEWLDGDVEPEAFETPEQAIEFATTNLGASHQRWVNQGLVQDEYLDAISGFPSQST